MESHFIGTLQVEHLQGSWYRLTKGLGYYSKKYNKTFYIPAGFITDYESVGRIPIVYALTKNTMVWASVLHDMLYRWPLCTRSEADGLFNEAGYVRELMLNRNDKSWFSKLWSSTRRNLMTGAVRLFGGMHYKSIAGCLNPLIHGSCKSECITCTAHYPYWKLCSLRGYQVNLYIAHETKQLEDYISLT